MCHSVATAQPSFFLFYHISVLSIVRDSCLADWGCWVSFLLMESKHLLCVPFKSTTSSPFPKLSAIHPAQPIRETPLVLKDRFFNRYVPICCQNGDQGIYNTHRDLNNGRNWKEELNLTMFPNKVCFPAVPSFPVGGNVYLVLSDASCIKWSVLKDKAINYILFRSH